MFDLSQQWGGDLAVGATGDLAVVDGSVAGEQRVLRRLMTSPGDYIWQVDYGAGLAQFIGQPVDSLQIKAVIRSQIFKEPAVARTPEPVVSVQTVPSEGAVYAQIRYSDSVSKETRVLSFSVTG